jgi:hypothetical protein
MKSSYPFYKISISYFNLKEVENDKQYVESIIVFKEDKPINSRKKAINHFRSLQDVFNDAEKNGTILSTIVDIFDAPVTAEVVPSLNLLICENENPDDDLVLFGTLLESTEERLIELTDESQLYHENNLDNDGFDVIVDIEGTMFTVLKGSLFTDKDMEKINYN